MVLRLCARPHKADLTGQQILQVHGQKPHDQALWDRSITAQTTSSRRIGIIVNLCSHLVEKGHGTTLSALQAVGGTRPSSSRSLPYFIKAVMSKMEIISQCLATWHHILQRFLCGVNKCIAEGRGKWSTCAFRHKGRLQHLLGTAWWRALTLVQNASWPRGAEQPYTLHKQKAVWTCT